MCLCFIVGGSENPSYYVSVPVNVCSYARGSAKLTLIYNKPTSSVSKTWQRSTYQNTIDDTK